MGMIVTWVVLLAVCASAVSSKVGNYDKHESGSYEKPKKCCKFKELTQEKQDKTYSKHNIVYYYSIMYITLLLNIITCYAYLFFYIVNYYRINK